MGGGFAGWCTMGWMQNDHRFAPHMHTPGYVREMIAAAEDPKPLLIEECKTQCVHW